MSLTFNQLSDIADALSVHVSVIENFYEEWESLRDDDDESFAEFLARAFAEAAFTVTATLPDTTAVECLEAYDEQYSDIETVLNELL